MMRGRGDNLTRCLDVHVRALKARLSVCLSVSRLTTCLVFPSQRHLLPSEHNRKSSRSSCQHEHQAISPQTFLLFFSMCCFLFLRILYIVSLFSSAAVGICDRVCVCVCAVPYELEPSAHVCSVSSCTRKLLNGSGHR